MPQGKKKKELYHLVIVSKKEKKNKDTFEINYSHKSKARKK